MKIILKKKNHTKVKINFKNQINLIKSQKNSKIKVNNKTLKRNLYKISK